MEKIGIGLVIRNYLGISLLANAIPYNRCYAVDYDNFWTSLNDIVQVSFSNKIVVESDSLVAITSIGRNAPNSLL